MRKSILFFCIVVLAVCLWLVLHGRPGQSKTETPQAQIPVPTLSQPPQGQPIAPTPAQTTPTSNAILNAVFRNSAVASNEIQQRALQKWQAPIDFYGKVIDENSNAVIGANITFKWTETPTEDGNRTFAAQSDNDGLFSLRDAHGPARRI
jgi:hypothetical protein